MDNDSSVNHLIRRMRETAWTEADLTDRVMQQVYAFHKAQGLQKRNRLKVMPVWVACVLLFAAAASVSAATIFHASWNGVQINILHNGGHEASHTEKNAVSYRYKLEAALSRSTAIWKTVSTEEAENQWAYSLLRPQASPFTLVQSFGVVPLDNNYRVKSADEWWLGGFYDLYQWEQQDIVVRQQLDGDMTKALKDGELTMSITYQDAPWENVEADNDTLAMFTANEYENLLVIKYKTADRKVISLEITGDLSKEDLLKLAKTYMVK
ncbi:hypothetical protein [Paenibacillus sp. 32352]|uniref:hypothetical protein n=1 Tax=Paenibacillus sp. 32352 TaxID=1969111 RepID=UPI0009AEABE6|nr:hypothetical protein [Paenibacillus sp. 32352]